MKTLSISDKIAAAARRFKAWAGRAPVSEEIVQVQNSQDVALVMGELEGVIYKSSADGLTYVHRFRKTRRPALLASFDGKQLYVLAGAYKLTERGIVG